MKDKNLNASPQHSTAVNEARKTPPHKKKKKHSKAFLIFKKLMAVIATTLLSLLLVIIITGTIVSTAMAAYVINFMDDSTNVTLQQLESGSNTYFYGNKTNENGEVEQAVIHTVKSDFQRIPVSIDRIPQHVRNAFVYTEDERFYVHDGVDYKRTFSAFLNFFLHFYDTEQGGSTITQQLIKNLSGDKDHTPQRKIREIFAAMQLEKSYSKDEILEEYLNYIGFGGAVNGIQMASLEYFGKSVENLTIPEAAVLAAIPKSPEEYGPDVIYYRDDDPTQPVVIDGRANNKPRQEYVLYKLYENGAITYDEYQEYLVTPLLYRHSEEYKKLHPEDDAEDLEEKEKAYTWVVDATYFEATKIFMEKFDLDYSKAMEKLQKGGYRVYTTYDDQMQSYVEERMLDINNMIPEYLVRREIDLEPFNNPDGTPEVYLPHIGFIAMNYDGEVLCAVGNIGEKTGSLVDNFAVKNKRQVGSTIKPITSYGYGIETGQIHWSSTVYDSPLPPDVIVGDDGQPWPKNYMGAVGTGQALRVYYALQQSFNTAPAQLLHKFGLENVFKFSTEKLGLDLVTRDREGYSPMTLGALTEGVTLENLVNAYIPYGNNGIYNEAHIISRIEDSTQQIIYQNNGNPRQAVSEETAYVMNRLMKNVVDNGTGTAARLSNKVVCGKTGTTQDWYDEVFVGLTPDFASGMTMGYKYNDDYLNLQGVVSAQIWQNIIGEYANTRFPDTPSDFEKVKSVIEMPMCTSTGLIASANCGKGAIGYWKSEVTDTYSPPYCDGGHWSAPAQTNTGTAANGNTTGGTATGGDATGGGAAAGGNAGGDTTGGGAAGGGAAAGGDAGGYTGGDAGGGAAAGGDAGGYTGGDAGGGAAAGGDTGGV